MPTRRPTHDQARPAFWDEASCRLWLGQLQLTNLNLAQASLSHAIEEFNQLAAPGKVRLQTLEALRETVAQVQHDFAIKLAGKALPLSDEEFSRLAALVNLWQAMLDGYLRCVQMASAGDATLQEDLALLYQRCLFYARCRLTAFSTAGYAPDARSWLQFHALYAAIEASPLRLKTVRDPFYHEGLPVSCQTFYGAALLLHRARLLGLTRRQLLIAERWLLGWPEVIEFVPSCKTSKTDAPPLAVDLNAPHGLRSLAHIRSTSSLRFLPMVPLSKQIRVKTILLRQGQTPHQLELGRELTAKDCLKLLETLHTCWCEAHTDTLADVPRKTQTVVHLCAGLEKSYGQIAQKPFKPVKDLSKAVRDAQLQIATFGRVLDTTEQLKLQELGFAAETWQVESQSLLRARLLRIHPGERLLPHQLVTVFNPANNACLAGMAEQIEVTPDGTLYLVVRYLPGQPQAVIAQAPPTSQDTLQSGSAPALILPAMPALQIPASLILPRGWFAPGRKVELIAPDRSKRKIALGLSVESGSDYERVSFESL